MFSFFRIIAAIREAIARYDRESIRLEMLKLADRAATEELRDYWTQRAAAVVVRYEVAR